MRIGNRLALLIWLVIPFLFIWIISLRQPLFTDRYLIWTAPAFYLMIASSLGALASSESWIRWAVVPLIGILLLSNGVNLWKQASDPLKSDFRAAAAYVADYPESKASTAREERYNGYPFNAYLPLVAAERPASDELIIFQIPHGRYTFDYYFPRDDYAWADGLYTNPREPDGPYMSEREATRHMRAMTEGYDVVWLIATEVPMWDEHNLVQRWLDEHLTCVAEDHFTRVDVYRYVK